MILADQMQDGSWVPDASDPPNSPADVGHGSGDMDGAHHADCVRPRA